MKRRRKKKSSCWCWFCVFPRTRSHNSYANVLTYFTLKNLNSNASPTKCYRTYFSFMANECNVNRLGNYIVNPYSIKYILYLGFFFHTFSRLVPVAVYVFFLFFCLSPDLSCSDSVCVWCMCGRTNLMIYNFFLYGFNCNCRNSNSLGPFNC